MVDRLEELLALLEDEDDEDEREDASVVEPGPEAPAPPAPAELEADEDTPVKAALPHRVLEAGDIPLERQEEIDGAIRDDAAAEKTAGPWDELTAVVTGRNGAVLLRRPGAGDMSLAELAGADRQPDGAIGPMTSAERGLERLYKQTVQASRPAAQILPAERAGQTARAEEPGRTAALTVEELDRAVRRDSRRYDGGMTLF